MKILAPSEPHSVLGLAGAYASPGTTPPKTVRWFAKSASSAATDGEDVPVPASLDALKCEVELVIVIGQRVQTLEPGDVIFTGTTKSFIAEPGDVVVTEVEGLGRLTNRITKGAGKP